MYDIHDVQLFDDEVYLYNGKVKNVQDLKSMVDAKEMIFLQAATVPNIANLFSGGVLEENIFILKGDPLRGQDALLKFCEDESIRTVLDVGCGKGNHAKIFIRYGKMVTGIEAGFSCKIQDGESFQVINDVFEKHSFDTTYDLVWCSHVLEHQQNISSFICKLFECCSDTGKVAITVPDGRDMHVVEGHVTCWNVGLLMYNIIRCGYSCKNAMAKTYAGNVSIIVTKEKIRDIGDSRRMDNGRMYFPDVLDCGSTRFGGINFDGNIEKLNWQ